MIKEEVLVQSPSSFIGTDYQQLPQQIEDYEWLERALSPVFDADDVFSLMSYVRTLMAERFSFDRFGILVGTVNSKYCVVHEIVTQQGMEACPPGSLMVIQATGLERVYQQQCLHYNPDISLQPEFIEDEELATMGLRSLVRLPLLAKNKVFGVMTVKSVEPNHYTEADLQLMSIVAKQLSGSISHLKQVYELRLKSYQDSLTGVFNRRFIEDVFHGADGASLVEQMTAVELPDDGQLTVMFLDINNFKGLNDQSGHGSGDSVLAATANMISSVILHNGFVARYGGDEFVVVLPGISESQGTDFAEQLAGQLRVYNQQRRPADDAWRLEISCGSATGNWADFRELLSVADTRMYGNKS